MTGERPFDVYQVREDFPILSGHIYDKPLVYLDNASTTQKPQTVIDAICHFYTQNCANVHRGVHTLSDRATDHYETAREKVRAFVNAQSTHEIIFTRGATEGLNLVASSFGERLKSGDEVIISGMEHHSNIVPWQRLRDLKGVVLKIIPITDQGELDFEAFKNLLSKKTKLVSVVHVSNAIGTVNPVKEMVKLAHAQGVPVMVDGVQAMPQLPVDVRDLDCDFYAFSGHKLFGPTGIGVLYGREALLESMPPYQCGGDMILSVTFEKTIYNELPYKFEAGTPPIAGAIGLGAAIDYLKSIDWRSAIAHKQRILKRATEAVSQFKEVRLIGTAKDKTSVLSFVINGIHAHDIGTILDREGIAIRAGHHCTQPLMERFGVPATARASFAFYNTVEEVDRLVKGIKRVLEIFR